MADPTTVPPEQQQFIAGIVNTVREIFAQSGVIPSASIVAAETLKVYTSVLVAMASAPKPTNEIKIDWGSAFPGGKR